MDRFDTFEEFLRDRNRCGWSIERAREHWRISNALRQRMVPVSARVEVAETSFGGEAEAIGSAVTEGTPLLGGVATGAAAAAAAATGPSTGAILRGAGIGAGILIGGGILAGTGNYSDGDSDVTDDEFEVPRDIPLSDSDDDMFYDSDLDEPLEKSKEPILTFPDHSYLGPGNTVDGQIPHDLDDEIAREHDIGYLEATDDSDIDEADTHAIHDSVSDVIDTGNPHSALGAIGLGIKQAVERQTGVIYPNGMYLCSKDG